MSISYVVDGYTMRWVDDQHYLIPQLDDFEVDGPIIWETYKSPIRLTEVMFDTVCWIDLCIGRRVIFYLKGYSVAKGIAICGDSKDRRKHRYVRLIITLLGE
jgi:hypothetical protein